MNSPKFWTAMRRDILSLINTPYRYGVEVDLSKWPPKSLDCSEFIELLFSRQGVACPDGSRFQHRASESVLNVRFGDLAFFGRPGKKSAGNPHGIYHVGIVFSSTMMVEARAKNKKGEYGKVIFRPRSKWEAYGPFKRAGGYRRLKVLL